ncbi:ATPase family associated with various cellular activities (AAA) [Actinoplanes regularis]|uniref:ATPase family associated with various cellular activities (AAA) n=1 Tax=Actinoplanes regularis TaxID=52697 RepID=A0A239C2Q3_9ACTN|nr:ATPase family associated with various cellular activities (AAA) [Actinoplanes regularis]
MRKSGFDAFDETVIALAMAPDLDPVLAVATSALTAGANGPGPQHPTLALIADLTGATGPARATAAARLSPGGPLARVGLIHIVPDPATRVAGDPPRGPSMLATCVASTALLRWAFGVFRLDPALFPLVRDDLLAPERPPDPDAAAALLAVLRLPAPSLTSLEADRATDALSTALVAVARSRRPALVVSADALMAPASAQRVAAEALLRQAVLIVTGEADLVPPAHWEPFATAVVAGQHPVLPEDPDRTVRSLLVRGWSTASAGGHLVDVLRTRGLLVAPAEAKRLERWSHLPAEDVGRLAATLAARAAGREDDEPSARRVTSEDVTSVAVGVVGRDLTRLASPLRTSRDWDRIALPPALRTELAEFVDQAAQRSSLLTEAGFGELPGQPHGITAVFAGPSGSGKTFAARLVAGDLGLPLYRVDLARVVSKYIGETEQNLDAVFAAAEESDAILLFDEAESLFGKRSEVQDARDRYANLEIAFLLQRMEDYEGVAILSTNLLGHLDGAFARRLSFCLHFPFPEQEQRAEIWRAVWPPQITLADDVDLDRLAALHPLSGGHIRNVALAAASLARAAGHDVDAGCIRRGLDREYAKLGVAPDRIGVAS